MNLCSIVIRNPHPMKRDKELLKSATKIVRDFAGNTLYRLPASSFQKIAQDMINNDRIGDGGWIAKSLLKERKRIQEARNCARKFGYAPFSNLGFYTFRWIKEQYAGWVLPLMATGLEKPEDVYPVWGVQFADAMDALGMKACENTEDLYSFVTSSTAWEEAVSARQDYLEEFKLHKKKQKNRRMADRYKKKPHTPGHPRAYRNPRGIAHQLLGRSLRSSSAYAP